MKTVASRNATHSFLRGQCLFHDEVILRFLPLYVIRSFCLRDRSLSNGETPIFVEEVELQEELTAAALNDGSR